MPKIAYDFTIPLFGVNSKHENMFLNTQKMFKNAH